MIAFDFTPEEAQTTAIAVYDHLESTAFTVQVEEAVDQSAPFRPTLIGESDELRWLIEAQGTPNYSPSLRNLVHYTTVNQVYGEVYIATSENASISGKLFKLMRRDGIGLLLVDEDKNVEVELKARNPALMVKPDPTLKLGQCGPEVNELVGRFNAGDRLAALRQMCEVVERETGTLITKAARKSLLDRPEPAVKRMDWSERINTLANHQRYTQGRSPLFTTDMKNDMHSFRGARNLIDHPAPNRRAERKRQTQFTERMVMGPRLTAELLALQRRAARIK